MYIKYHLSTVGKVEQLSVSKPSQVDKLEFFYDQLDCELVEVVPLDNSTILICDEEGWLVSKNPVFDINFSERKENIQIAGTFIIAKVGENFEITGLNSSDIKEVSGNISVSRFGNTK